MTIINLKELVSEHLLNGIPNIYQNLICHDILQSFFYDNR